jgi:predicted Zn-dependent protease
MRFGVPETLAAAIMATVFLANCATNPVTGGQDFVMMSEADELRLGQKASAEVGEEYKEYKDPELQRYLDRIGQKLARASHRPNIPYHFTVVDSPDINAFALPGGYVYVTRGILAYLDSEAELAAVVGHEIGHVTARHSVRQYSAATAAQIGASVVGIVVPELGSGAAQGVIGTMSDALLKGYGRDHELEADRLGAEYLARTGYDPEAMIRVVGVLKDQELFDAEIARAEGREPRAYHGLFATHPDNDTRLQEVVGAARKYASKNTAEGKDEYLRVVNGLVFGDSPSQGVVRGSDFYHAELGFALQFPAGWQVKNHADRVQAYSPARDALMEMRLIEKPQATAADTMRQSLRLPGGTAIETGSVHGLPAAFATYYQSSGRPVRAGIVLLGGKGYVIAGTAKSNAEFNRYSDNINTAIRSFHRITNEERQLARPLRIKLYTARKGDTFAGLAKVSPLGKNAEGYLRLMNSAYPRGEPVPGQTLKIVE